MSDPDAFRIERQTSDAAKRLARTTGEAVAAVTIVDHGEGRTGMAYATEGLTLQQVEFACFMLLNKIAEDRMPGSAEGCDECKAAWSRVSAAAEILRPAFGPSWATKGACQ